MDFNTKIVPAMTATQPPITPPFKLKVSKDNFDILFLEVPEKGDFRSAHPAL